MNVVERVKAVPLRWAVPAGIVVLVIIVVAAIDIHPSFGHVDATLLTGSERGNYHALGDKLSARARAQAGRLTLQTSHGTVDNLEQLAAAGKGGCEKQFAFVQDGVAPPEGGGIELVARLPSGEAFFLLGKDAGRFTKVADLAKLRIGMGPAKSGTNRLARVIFESEQLAALGVQLENHDLTSQMEAIAKGDLDLGAFVMHEDAELIRHAIVEQGLSLVAIDNLGAIAHRHRFLQTGEIVTGQFDAIRELPPGVRKVLEVGTLVVGNGCASHAQTVGLLMLLDAELPGFIAHNRQHGGSEIMPRSSTGKSFFDNQGPELVEVHVPWLVDLLPPANWVYIAMVLSVLFNIMGIGHRFRLWRIDANRVRVDQGIRDVLGSRLTPEEIHDLEPEQKHVSNEVVASVEHSIEELGVLRDRCRKQSLSMLVPMGQEMAYRYQEDQIEEQLTALRLFRQRLVAALGSEA